MTKNENRIFFLKKRQEIPPRLLQEGIFKRNQRFLHFLASELTHVEEKKHFFIFYSYRSEPSTHELIVELLEKGHQVSLPRVSLVNNSTHMEAVPIASLADLTGFYQSIPQPADHLKKVEISSIDMVIVPSLAINSQGFRLGYGGGFYDKLIAVLPNTTQTIAWQYEDFCGQNFPIEAHDLPVQFACTEESWKEF